MRLKASSTVHHAARRSRTRKSSFPWLLLMLPIVLWMGVRLARFYFEQPDAILMLGGSGGEREKFTAQFARQHSNLPIWISSGAPREYSEWVFSSAGIKLDRLHLDYQATDTVTNFTTLVDQLRDRGVHSVYLVTSDYHIRRAQIIAEIVLGSRGIQVKPIAVPSGKPQEPLSKSMRDGGRALLWVTTGHTGASLAPLKEGRP